MLGATSQNIVLILSYQFLKPVFIANIIGWTASYYIMKSWLADFAYRIDLEIGVFIVAAISVLLVSMITVGIQSYKASTANPVDSLKYE